MHANVIATFALRCCESCTFSLAGMYGVKLPHGVVKKNKRVEEESCVIMRKRILHRDWGVFRLYMFHDECLTPFPRRFIARKDKVVYNEE